jgi:hypothetical protein
MMIAPVTLANQEQIWMQQQMEELILENHWVTMFGRRFHDNEDVEVAVNGWECSSLIYTE